ncbi:hypothetical protein FG386_000164 [Cryptosporidium ryanae]|uniref:uncharacterized protein n=1 Tax=Cryptosporidium ryanae TaxID=515981 RepID=UPI00351A161E|nr:hypothetical protein FG386_000164 [Cryptosporidium ryanae]
MLHERLREHKKSVGDRGSGSDSLEFKLKNGKRKPGCFSRSNGQGVPESSPETRRSESSRLSRITGSEKSEEAVGKTGFCSQSLKSNDSSTKEEYVRSLRSMNCGKKRKLIIGNGFSGSTGPKTSENDLFTSGGASGGTGFDHTDGKGPGEPDEKRIPGGRHATSYKYYDILDVQLGSGLSEIRKSYRRKAAKYHPDKLKRDKLTEKKYGECLEKFQEIRDAYEVLGNPSKKELYDEYGDEILKYGIFESLSELKEAGCSADLGFGGPKSRTEPAYREHARQVHRKRTVNGQGGDAQNSNGSSVGGGRGDCGERDFEWQMHWQRLLMELFIVPVLRNNCLELRDVGGMNISVSGYRELVGSSQRYLRNMKNLPEILFRSPVSLSLSEGYCPKAGSGLEEESRGGIRAGARNSLFSRLTEKTAAATSSSLRFNNVQVICSSSAEGPTGPGYGRGFSLSGLGTGGADKFSDSVFGLVFGESSESWERLLELAKTAVCDNYDGVSGSLKRRLKSIQNDYSWIVLVFVSEEFLPLSDQELLLELYTLEDATRSCSFSASLLSQSTGSLGGSANKEIIDCTADFKSLSLFPCLVFRPKRNEDTRAREEPAAPERTSSREDIVYTRPSGSHIETVRRTLEFVFRLDETGFHEYKDKHCKLITG